MLVLNSNLMKIYSLVIGFSVRFTGNSEVTCC